MKYNRTIRFLSKIIPYPSLEKSGSFVEWKNRLLFVLLGGLVILGLIAYIPSLILSVKQGLWMVALIDTVVYLTVLVVAFSKKLHAETKVKITLVTFYVLGIAILVMLGQEGAGFNWLFMFPLLTSFFYGFRGLVVSSAVNFVSLGLLLIPVYFNIEELGLIAQYNTGGWIVNSVNFMVVSTLSSLALSFIIINIDKALRKEKKMTLLLQVNRDKLAIEKKRAEESDQLKSAFLSNMSHEIRTPMNAILGFSGLLTEPGLPPDKVKLYNTLITISGEQLLRIIDDIIDISKIELNQMSIDIQPMHVYPGLVEIVNIMQNKIDSLKKPIKIELQVAPELQDLVIETDEIRFRQIVNNLAGNAVKYTDSGTISMGYTLKKDNGNTVAEFFVKDTGRGIPKESFEKIFNRFTQADNVDFKEGTGLGLSITKGLLDLLGGKIGLQSELDKGSEFWFTLPCDTKIDLPVNEHQERNNVKVHDYSGKIIYIAEDDEVSFYYLREILKRTKITIRHALNGKELLGLIHLQKPDLVLLDINMPEMNGFEAIQEIRKIYPHLPVIAQTAYAMTREQDKCMAHGCNGYLAKPIKPEVLLRLLSPYLGNN